MRAALLVILVLLTGLAGAEEPGELVLSSGEAVVTSSTPSRSDKFESIRTVRAGHELQPGDTVTSLESTVSFRLGENALRLSQRSQVKIVTRDQVVLLSGRILARCEHLEIQCEGLRANVRGTVCCTKERRTTRLQMMDGMARLQGEHLTTPLGPCQKQLYYWVYPPVWVESVAQSTPFYALGSKTLGGWIAHHGSDAFRVGKQMDGRPSSAYLLRVADNLKPSRLTVLGDVLRSKQDAWQLFHALGGAALLTEVRRMAATLVDPESLKTRPDATSTPTLPGRPEPTPAWLEEQRPAEVVRWIAPANPLPAYTPASNVDTVETPHEQEAPVPLETRAPSLEPEPQESRGGPP